MPDYFYFAAGLLVLAYIIYNQVRVRQVRARVRLLLPLILIAAGLPNLASLLNKPQGPSPAIIAALGSFLAISIIMGILRALTVKIWRQNEAILRKGTMITVVLWMVTAGVHIGIEQIGHIGQSTLLLSLGITFLVQRWVIHSRVLH